MFEMKIEESEAVKWFRVILVAQIVFAVLATIAGLTLESTLPAGMQEYVAKQDKIPKNVFLIFVSLLLLGILVLTIIGLWNFRNWARKLYLALLVVSVPSALLGGPIIMNSWEWVFWILAEYLDAWSFFMIFFVSPIKEQFHKQNKWKRNWQERTVKGQFKAPHR